MRYLSRLAVLLLVVAPNLSVEAQGDTGCRCCDTTTESKVALADVVFVGRVVEAEYRWSLINWAYASARNLVRFDGGRWMAPKTKRTATLLVRDTLKGEVRDEWTIHAFPTDGWCGVEFEVGEEYLVFGGKRGVQMWSGKCMGSRTFDATSDDLEHLRVAMH
jgi:hypothetical protein